MKDKILALEAKAMQLEPGQEKRTNWNEQVLDYANRFLEGLPEAPAFLDDDNKGEALLDFPIPENPVAIDKLIPLVEEAVDKPALNPASGKHLGYIPGGGVYPGALGDYMASVANNYAGIFYAGPGAVRMENMLIRWMAGFLGYPETALGNLASGGSIATRAIRAPFCSSMAVTVPVSRVICTLAIGRSLADGTTFNSIYKSLFHALYS